ncbi:MAG: ABC transporter ATP-binding protein [Bacteroidota bacterium]
MSISDHPAEYALSVAGVKKTYGEFTLGPIAFQLPKQQILAMIGASGCGKTTLLRLIAGLEVPDAGEIALGGKVVAGPQSWTEPEKRKIGMVFQDYALFPHLSVQENIRFGLKKVSKQVAKDRVAAMLELVNLSTYGKRFPHELSGGEQQRVALARALAPEPGILLMDEPFSNLDVLSKDQMRAEVKDIIRRSKATAILVTHDVEDALQISDQMLVLKAGQPQQYGRPEALQKQPANDYVQQLLSAGTPQQGRMLRKVKTDQGWEITYLEAEEPSQVDKE